MISHRLGTKAKLDLDSHPNRGCLAHLWLEGPCHTALHKEVGAGRLSVRGSSATPHRQILFRSTMGAQQVTWSPQRHHCTAPPSPPPAATAPPSPHQPSLPSIDPPPKTWQPPDPDLPPCLLLSSDGINPLPFPFLRSSRSYTVLIVYTV
jgi:hypothetical protein